MEATRLSAFVFGSVPSEHVWITCFILFIDNVSLMFNVLNGDCGKCLCDAVCSIVTISVALDENVPILKVVLERDFLFGSIRSYGRILGLWGCRPWLNICPWRPLNICCTRLHILRLDSKRRNSSCVSMLWILIFLEYGEVLLVCYYMALFVRLCQSVNV